MASASGKVLFHRIHITYNYNKYFFFLNVNFVEYYLFGNIKVFYRLVLVLLVLRPVLPLGNFFYIEK